MECDVAEVIDRLLKNDILNIKNNYENVKFKISRKFSMLLQKLQ